MKHMRIYYFETHDGMGCLLMVSGDRWILYADVINDIPIRKDTIREIVDEFMEYDFDGEDFDELYEDKFGVLRGEDFRKALDGRNAEIIYSI